MIPKSQLNAKNNVMAITVLAVPGFGIIIWRLEEMEKMQ
jgi:hypothetical protein